MAHHPSASGTSASPQKIGDLVNAFPPASLLASYAGAPEVAGLTVLVVSSSAHASAVGWIDCGLFSSFCLWHAGIYDERRYQANGHATGHATPRSRTPPRSGRGALTATDPDERDSGMVDCPCGVTYDDGQAMIECERCKVGISQKSEQNQVLIHGRSNECAHCCQ